MSVTAHKGVPSAWSNSSNMICTNLFMFMSQDGLTGSAWGDWANYTASPLRAFENELGVQAPVGFWGNELGVQAPVGFWDPAGFTSDGSVEDFTRRRQTELKHGRISMLATMGYITPEKLFGNQCPPCGCEKNTQTQVVLRWQHGNMCNLLC